jgi:hypothetical protein
MGACIYECMNAGTLTKSKVLVKSKWDGPSNNPGKVAEGHFTRASSSTNKFSIGAIAFTLHLFLLNKCR